MPICAERLVQPSVAPETGLGQRAFPLTLSGGGDLPQLGNAPYAHQSSWTHWGHYFELELSGTEGFLSFDYGQGSATNIRPVGGRERLRETVSFDLKAPDQSWVLELEEFRGAIWEDREPLGNGQDGLEALVMSEALYCSSMTARAVRLEEVRRASQEIDHLAA